MFLPFLHCREKVQPAIGLPCPALLGFFGRIDDVDALGIKGLATRVDQPLNAVHIGAAPCRYRLGIASCTLRLKEAGQRQGQDTYPESDHTHDTFLDFA